MTMRTTAAVALVAVLGCSSEPKAPSAEVDAGRPDAARDTAAADGSVDVAAADTGADDAGAGDAGADDAGAGDTGGSDGGAFDAASCVAPQVACGEKCVDLTSDPAHCGACGAACVGDEKCVSKACKLSCASGTFACASRCVDLLTDAANCGMCGKKCPAGSICKLAACERVCTATETKCFGDCVDLKTDAKNCGACGRSCSGASTCVAGECACAGGIACGTACVDPTKDPANCGGCGKSCGPGGSCADGACTCGAGYTKCGTSCHDLSADVANCGACGVACPTGAICASGTCTDAWRYLSALGTSADTLLPKTMATIPGVAGRRIRISRVGICGDSDTTSGPNLFAASDGAGMSFSWWAGQSTPSSTGTTYALAACPSSGTGSVSGRGWSYQTVDHVGAVGASVTVRWDYHLDWDGRYCEAAAEDGTSYVDAASTVRALVKWRYE
jgi:hypothetical protein